MTPRAPGDPHRRERRLRLTAILLAGPVLCTALGVVVVEAWRSARPASPLFAAPVAASFADAIRADDVRSANVFLHAGQQPDELIAVNDASLTGGKWLLLSPLVWAVATDSPQSVRMLLGAGAGGTHATDRRAACLADALGHDEIARTLRLYQSDAPDICGGETDDGPPLVTFLSAFE